MNSEIIDAIQYDEQHVDIEAIMRQIRQYLAQKHGSQTPVSSEAPASVMLDREVYDELFEANQTFDKVHVAPYVTSNRVPLVGVLWQRVRSQIHALVVFYVNRAADSQVRFNSHVIRILNGIVQSLDADGAADRISALERRVEALEGQLHAPEARAATTASEVEGDV